MKLSEMFAIYVESVITVPHSCERIIAYWRRLRSIEDLSGKTGLVDSDTSLSVHSVGSQWENSALEELKIIRTVAMDHTEVIATEMLKFLEYRGYTLKDFAVWNWILIGKTAMDAALCLQLVTKQQRGATADLGRVPLFVFQKLLLRNDMSAEALSIFIQQIWQFLSYKNQQNDRCAHTEQPPLRGTSESVGLDELSTIVVRLLRHVRKVWPAAITDIAELWVTHAQNNGTNMSRLAFHYNRILQLIALPSDESPYQSLHHRQRAFFILFRRMIDPSLRLEISREGYRALIQIQLAHQKTASEREWALLKGLTWPPYKEDRTGMDVDIQSESGVSRATTVLRDAAARGYGPREWERAAAILAGIDDDQSPTIQTRSTVVPISRSSVPRCSIASLPPGREHGSDRIRKKPRSQGAASWTARIKATRTLQEAWMCFLICRDQGTSMNPQLYEVMFEKVIYNGKREQDIRKGDGLKSQVSSTSKQSAVPGDGKEVAESDVSHNQAISTREPLPTINSLFEHMLGHGVRPSGRLLELLVSHAQSYKEGVEFLQQSRLHKSVKAALLSLQALEANDAATSDSTLLKTVSDRLFAAWVNLLCKSAQTAHVPDNPSAGNDERREHLERAFRLVKIRSPMYRPPWNALLRLLSRHASKVAVDKNLGHPPAVIKFDIARQLLNSMDSLSLGLDFTCFSYLCAIAINANAATDRWPGTQKAVPEGVMIVKTRFAQLVRPSSHLSCVTRLSDYCCCPDKRGNDGISLQPRLFRTPHPAYLHAYIRCLGHYQDWDGLGDLMHWLAEFAGEIIAEARETANGLVMFRRCFTALRAHGGNESPQLTKEESERYGSKLEGLRDVMHAREDDWGGWPTDDEAERYLLIASQRSCK
ncbi:MAG: hypothetical protein LQ337_002656 [Flavoplaca oasis]|nr:MAG: hypothetical protein LQ337_002656 [Flavoplaca oasis]